MDGGYIDTSKMVVESHSGRRRWREVDFESNNNESKASSSCVKEERV